MSNQQPRKLSLSPGTKIGCKICQLSRVYGGSMTAVACSMLKHKEEKRSQPCALMRSMHSWLCSWLSCRSSWQRSLLRCTRLRKSSPRCSATSPSNFSTRSTAVRRRRLAPAFHYARRCTTVSSRKPHMLAATTSLEKSNTQVTS